jgi:hypothetical protein
MRPAALAFLVVLVLPSCTRIGDECDDTDDCGDGLICHRADTEDDGASTTGICGYARLARGEVCASTDECDTDLFCSNDLPSDTKQRFGTCIDVQHEGDPCFRDENCATGLVCSIPEGEETGGCHPAPVDAGIRSSPVALAE